MGGFDEAWIARVLEEIRRYYETWGNWPTPREVILLIKGKA